MEIVERALWEGVEANPQRRVIIRPDWVQTTMPQAPAPHLNGVLRCELEGEAVEAVVVETIEHYKRLKLPFRWKIAPSTRPKNLSDLLVKHGMYLKETLFGLVARPDQLNIPANPEVCVEELDLQNLEDWLSVQASAWGVPPQGIAFMRMSQIKSLEAGDKRYWNFLAYLNDQPVASAAVQFHTDYAFLMGAAVNPDQRRQGIYRSLLSHRLKLIGERGLPAVIHCLENTSAPICLRLGFEKVCEIFSYELSTPAETT